MVPPGALIQVYSGDPLDSMDCNVDTIYGPANERLPSQQCAHRTVQSPGRLDQMMHW